MKSHEALVSIALLLAIAFVTSVIMTRTARGGEKMICHLEPVDSDGWHYRTKVGGRSEQCWYMGERMKPRKELYWAETPTVPPEIPPMTIIAPEPEFIWHPQGWDHKE